MKNEKTLGMTLPWPEWQIVEKIGEGSFGRVYKAERREEGSVFFSAVKIISIPQTQDELKSLRMEGLSEQSTRSYYKEILSDFINEIKVMEYMKGTSNIVSVEDFRVIEKTNEFGWDIIIRMEYLTSFVEYITDRKLSVVEVIKLGIDVCSALELCAKKSIIHRDIKPENIFISSFGDFKLGDFGVARELEKTRGSLSSKGTYNYMAPEILTSKHYGATVDLYSLGIVLYKLLNNNRLPFLDPYAQNIGYKEREDAVNRRISGEALPPPVQANDNLATVVLKACEFNPENRFINAAEMKKALIEVNNSSKDKHTDLSLTEAIQTEIKDNGRDSFDYINETRTATVSNSASTIFKENNSSSKTILTGESNGLKSNLDEKEIFLKAKNIKNNSTSSKFSSRNKSKRKLLIGIISLFVIVLCIGMFSYFSSEIDNNKSSEPSSNISPNQNPNEKSKDKEISPVNEKKSGQNVNVTELILNKSSLTIEVGSTKTLTITISPSNATDKRVSWSSNDTSVASVKNGVVTGNRAGTAIITVTTVDGGFSKTCTITVVPKPTTTPTVTVPPIPSGLKLEWTAATTAKVSWNASAGATSYEVEYKVGNGSWTKSYNYKSGTSYTSTDMVEGSTYSFRVKAVNSAGSSGWITVTYTHQKPTTAPTVTVPPTPTGLKLEWTAATTAKVSWNASTGASSYAVEYKVGNGSWTKSYNYKSGTSYTSTDMVEGSTYSFRVKAVNSAGSSGWIEVTYTHKSPTASLSAPTGLKVVKSGTTTAKISWSKVDGAATYEVWIKSTNEGNVWKKSETYKTSSGATSYTSYLIDGETCIYKVKAIDASGKESAFSGEVTYKHNSSPAAPTGLKIVKSGATTATVSWNKVDGATSYEVWIKSTEEGNVWKKSTTYNTSSGASTYISYLIVGETCVYRVKAFGADGKPSPWSAEVTYVHK